jgi:hypothetical protein
LENNKVIAIQHRPPEKNKTKGKVEKIVINWVIWEGKKRKYFTGMFESVIIVIF